MFSSLPRDRHVMLTLEHTFLLHASVVVGSDEIVRQVAVPDTVTIGELQDILDTCFGFPAVTTPRHCHKGTVVLEPNAVLVEALTGVGDAMSYFWGLWQIDVKLIDWFSTDRATTTAVCLGGHGEVYDGFDVDTINHRLTGASTVLTLARDEVVELIETCKITDFIALLHAIDVSRSPDLDPQLAMVCAVLPVEEAPRQRQAFWATVLGLSCMGDEELTDRIIETVVRALGWDESAAQVRALCAESLHQLALIGGLDSPVDRIEIYRELLRL